MRVDLVRVPQRHRIDLLDDIRKQRAQLDAYEAALLSAMAPTGSVSG